MSGSEVLYARNMNLTESEDEGNEHDIWDDRKLNDAYDKAMSIAKVEVAKRIAMATNTQTQTKDGSKPKKPAQSSAPLKNEKKGKTKWKAGMHCRAVYEDDGIEYEALLLRIINGKECVVRFIGYENSEIVPINTLKPSLGTAERNKQIAEALEDNLEDDISAHSVEEMQCSDRTQSSASLASSKKKKSKKTKSKPKPTNEFKLPDLPSMPMPNFSHLKNLGLGAMDMPVPPPPLFTLPHHDTDSEEQGVSSMLLSWFMSGYYTGLYQGMKRAREGRKHK